jgi:hypothetical protein
MAVAVKKRRRKYEPRVFDGRIIMPDEIERIHKEVLGFERIKALSDPMRELIEELWPELIHKLPPKNHMTDMRSGLRRFAESTRLPAGDCYNSIRDNYGTPALVVRHQTWNLAAAERGTPF